MTHRHIVTLRERLPSVATIAPAGIALAPPPPAPPRVPEAQLHIDSLVASLDGLAHAVTMQRELHRVEILEMSIELGIAIAEKVVGAAIAMNRQRLDTMMLEMLKRVQPDKPISIRGNPADLELLESQSATSQAFESRRNTMNFRPDASCPRGKLRIDADDRFVELDLQRALADLRGSLLEQLFTDE